MLFTVWRKLPWLRDARLVVPWTLRIAARRVWRHTARERRGAAVRALFLARARGFALTARDPGFDVDVAKALEAIPDVSPSSRVILTLHYVDGLPLAEVAEELGVSLGTASRGSPMGSCSCGTGWGRSEVERETPVELELTVVRDLVVLGSTSVSTFSFRLKISPPSAAKPPFISESDASLSPNAGASTVLDRKCGAKPPPK